MQFFCKAIFNNNFLKFKLKNMRANNIFAIIFFLTKGLNNSLVFINLDYIFANKNPIINILLLTYKVFIVLKAKYRKICINNIQLTKFYNL